MRRVAVTGVGCVSALGGEVADFWGALCSGRSGIRSLESPRIDQLKVKIGAEVPDYNPLDHFDKKRLSLLDRFSQFALLAAREAVADADLDFSGALGEATAVVLGTAVGGKTTDDEAYRHLYGEGNLRVNPYVIPQEMVSAATSNVSMELGIRGPCVCVSTACSSANHAIGQAFWMVRQGVVDVALAGGSEAPFAFGLMKAWEAMRVLAPDTCRPFSKDRKGLVLGEGGAVLVLESVERARARDARVYAEISGFGMSADAGHITQPSEIGAASAIRRALEDAALSPGDVDYVNAHGTGTRANDVTESRALHQVFGELAASLAVSSTKSMHGHALGAAGGIELVATCLAVHHGIVPPTANFTELDPECVIDCVPNEAREQRLKAAISNSFAFGGLNAVIAVRAI